jgi:hypothetical protein
MAHRGQGQRQDAGSAHFSDCLNALDVQLEALAKRLKTDGSELPERDLKNWKERLFQIAGNGATLRNSMSVTKSVIQTELERVGNLDKTDENAENSALSIAKRIKGQVTVASKLFDASNAPITKRLTEILVDAHDEDADLVMEDDGDEGAQYICPFTATKMEDPYTKYALKLPFISVYNENSFSTFLILLLSPLAVANVYIECRKEVWMPCSRKVRLPTVRSLAVGRPGPEATLFRITTSSTRWIDTIAFRMRLLQQGRPPKLSPPWIWMTQATTTTDTPNFKIDVSKVCRSRHWVLWFS